jgi:hypothetical protein
MHRQVDLGGNTYKNLRITNVVVCNFLDTVPTPLGTYGCRLLGSQRFPFSFPFAFTFAFHRPYPICLLFLLLSIS